MILLCQLLVLSGCSVKASRASLPQDEVTYQVASGDTLHKVAERFGMPVKAIQTFNGISDPKSLKVGQLLRIPSLGPLSAKVGGRARDEELPRKGQGKAGQGTAPASDKPRMVSIAGVRKYLGNLRNPVTKARYTSSFGWRWGRFHEGMDLASKEGEKVLAAHAGTVVHVNESQGRYGKMVVVRGDNLLTVYSHNRQNRVAVGDKVEAGDWIADVGETGNATGPHLHLETRVLDESGKWAAVDPVIFVKKQ